MEALEDGHAIRSCEFCEQFDYWGTKECYKFAERVELNKAVDCEHFSMVGRKDLMGILADTY